MGEAAGETDGTSGGLEGHWRATSVTPPLKVGSEL